MKNNKKPKKLLTLLVLYFGVLSTLLMSLFIFINEKTIEILYQNYWDKNYNTVIDYINLLENGKFDEIPVKKLFGKKGYFDIVDENNNIIYSSGETHTYTQEDIENFDSIDSIYYSIIELKNSQKVVLNFKNTDNPLFYLLDENLSIINTNDDSGITSFTQKDLDIIDRNYADLSNKYTLSFKYNQKSYTLIAYESKATETYNDFINARIITFILLVIIYALIILAAINILRKRIILPLSKLKNAINEYTNNKVKIIIDSQDIKEFDEITKQFNKMTVDLDKMDNINKKYEEERQIMLANISHDLKTPITIIQGYSKAIIDGVVKGDEIINKNKIIYNKTIYINELVNNFHSFSKLEHPGFVYNFKNIDIAEYLRNYLANKYNELNMHNINLDIKIPEAKIIRKIDPNEFKRVFENIINNAIKYNDDGISIKVFLNNKKIIISNNGNPIPESTAKEIFKPFSMGDESRSKGGSGLGLSIVNKIIKDHKFKIHLETHPNSFYKVSFVIEI